MIELYRAIVPIKHVINENHSQHYKIRMSHLDWLTRQYKRIRDGEAYDNENVGFILPSIDDIKNVLKYPISIRFEIWRCTNRIFDPQNYATTMKAPLDLLVSDGYIDNDNWKFIKEIIYSGGGYEAWQNRAFRYKGDNLPCELSPEWWKLYSNDFNDILIRILAE